MLPFYSVGVRKRRGGSGSLTIASGQDRLKVTASLAAIRIKGEPEPPPVALPKTAKRNSERPTQPNKIDLCPMLRSPAAQMNASTILS